ncbi:MAG TPA: hypothetical protein VG053_01585 [Solirubrobacteraceae bacterium]|nr:hypothetical protein [Solirubrobacteraceae bacterium]
MRLSSRPFSLPAALRAVVSFRSTPTLATLAALWSLTITASAGAAVRKVPTGSGVEEVTVGLQPRSIALHVGAGPEPKQFANSSGAPVLPTNKTYAIYWDPTDNYHGDWQGLINTFFQNLGAGSGSLASVYAVDAQYTDAAHHHADYASVFQGPYTDTDPYPTSGNCVDPNPLEGTNYPWGEPAAITCITNTQIEAELKLFIADHKLPTGMGTIFYLLTPPGVTVCLDKGGPEGHCSDFSGATTEVTEYEEAKKSYPERLAKYEKEQETYEKELAIYEKAKAKYKAEVEKYEKEKAKDEAEGEPDVEAEPVAPTEPVKPVKPVFPKEPAGYKDYKNSFCSYHSDINPDSLPSGDSSTILYAAIPWVAGGLGDGHLSYEVPAYDCQDGGLDPSSNPVEEREKAKEKSKKEVEEFSGKNAEEKAKQEEAEALAGPHQQEPNQGSCPSPDGYCDTGLADLIVSQIGAEQQNIVTDPLLDSWRDPSGDEVTDECRNFFATSDLGGSVSANSETFGGTLFNQSLGAGSYYLNDAFNLAALKLPYPGIPCLGGVRLEPKFTLPNPVNSGEVVGFDGMESNVTLNWGTIYSAGKPKPTYATYTWNFGDQTPTVTGFAPGAPAGNSPAISPCGAEPWESPCAASVFHAFQYGGTYDVTLTVTDTGGNTASVTEPITVDGPPRPTSPSPGAGSGATGTGSSSNAPPSSGATTKPPVPGPVATQSVLSSSLSRTLGKGLVVRYSVSQQVTGHFEVLLAASIAHRIGLHGPLATGLPQGTPAQVVIAKALLVTTKAGRNTLKIQFGKVTAKRLRRLHRVQLMLRLNLRNAGGGTTTVLSKLTLH